MGYGGAPGGPVSVSRGGWENGCSAGPCLARLGGRDARRGLRQARRALPAAVAACQRPSGRPEDWLGASSRARPRAARRQRPPTCFLLLGRAPWSVFTAYCATRVLPREGREGALEGRRSLSEHCGERVWRALSAEGRRPLTLPRISCRRPRGQQLAAARRGRQGHISEPGPSGLPSPVSALSGALGSTARGLAGRECYTRSPRRSVRSSRRPGGQIPTDLAAPSVDSAGCSPTCGTLPVARCALHTCRAGACGGTPLHPCSTGHQIVPQCL